MENVIDAVDRAYLRETSFAPMTGKTAEAKTSGTDSRIADDARIAADTSRQKAENYDRSSSIGVRLGRPLSPTPLANGCLFVQ